MKTIDNLSWWKVLLIVASYLAIFLISAVIADLISSLIYYAPLKVIFSEVLLRVPITIGGVLFFNKKVLRIKASTTGLRKPSGSILVWVIVGLLIPLSVSFLLITLNDSSYLNQSQQLSSLRTNYNIAATIAMAFGAAVTEEFLFRGAILRILEKKWNLKVAIIIPSVFFGLMHLFMINTITFTDIILLVAGGSLAGIMFAMPVVYSKSLYPSMFLHFTWNLIFAGKYLKIGTDATKSTTANHFFELQNSSTFISGGNFGPEVSIIAILVYAMVIAGFIWALKVKRKEN